MTGEPVGHRAELMLAAYQRIAARMYTLDAHAGRRFLRDGGLTGATAEVAERVNTGAVRLWSRFNEVRRLADRIPAHPGQLGRRALADLDELLSAACVEIDAAGSPAFGSGEPVAATVTLADFADAVEADCARLLDLCSEVDAACGAVADAAADITARLDSAAALAEALGRTGDATLGDLREQRTTALREALADPLTAARAAAGARSAAAQSAEAAVSAQSSAASTPFAEEAAVASSADPRAAVNLSDTATPASPDHGPARSADPRAAIGPGDTPVPAGPAAVATAQPAPRAAVIVGPGADGETPGPAAGLAALAERVEAFHSELTELDATARDVPRRLARLRDRLTELGEAEAKAAEVCDLAARKILAPAPPRHHPAADRLTAELRAVEERAAQSDRYGAAAQLADVTSRLDKAERECRRVIDTAGALVDRRAELRGRLAAYSRKAARIGVIEEPRVAASAQTAREILALAPCDLRSATKAVRRFQQEISGAQEAPA